MLLFMAHSLEWTGLQMRNRLSGVLGTNDNPDSLILSWAQAFSVGFVELCRIGLKPFHLKKCCWRSLWLQLPKGHPGIWVFKNLPGSTMYKIRSISEVQCSTKVLYYTVYNRIYNVYIKQLEDAAPDFIWTCNWCRNKASNTFTFWQSCWRCYLLNLMLSCY